MFKKGDIVHYGMNGICEIADITTVDFPGVDKNRVYYVLHQKTGSETIYVAADGDTSKMRKIISREEAQELISRIPDLEPLKLRDEKKPEAEYKEALQKYDCIEMLRLIKCIYLRRKERIDGRKKVIAADEKYMRLAEDMLYQELGRALDIPKDQVLDYLIKKIENQL